MLAGKPYGGAADVYSFALVLWELLTLQLPFPDMTGIQAAFAVVARVSRGRTSPRPPARPVPPAAVLILLGPDFCVTRYLLSEDYGKRCFRL